ncbi:MAG: arsenate reductase [Flavobacteriales bacterium]|jgi:arsenate reductase
MKKIYHLKTCSTNQRILSELNLDGVELQEIKTQAISEKQLEEMRTIAGSYESLFSRKAMKYKSLGLKDKDLSEDDYKKYILEEYTFLKRPVAIVDDQIFIGNAKAQVEALTETLS